MNNNESEITPAMVVRRPRGRPPIHGLYSKYALQPLTEDKRKWIMQIMEGQQLVIAPADKILINLLARLLAQIELIGRWLSEHGFFQDDADGKSRGTISPLVAQYTNIISKASNLCGQLGLSPESRIKLGKVIAQADDIASKIQRAKDS